MKLFATLDGQSIDPSDPLIARLNRAILISLFTWRRANASDNVALPDRQGWWGDAFADQVGDRIGSRLWLLQREKLTAETLRRAQDYATEALAWLIDDGLASRVDVTAERISSGLALGVVVYRAEGGRMTLDLNEFWDELNV